MNRKSFTLTLRQAQGKPFKQAQGQSKRESFTLIELLIVIAILAVLATAVVLVLNPAQLMKQARDSTRLSDLASLNNALGLVLVDNFTAFLGTSTVVYVSIPDSNSTCSNLGLPTLPTGWSYNCVTSSTLRDTDGTGWVPVNFTGFSASSPISILPIDPINTTTTYQYYTYIPGGSFKLTAFMESTKHQTKTTKDGGVSDISYEIGSNLTLGKGIFPAGWIKVPGSSTYNTSDFYVMKYEAKCALASTPGTGLKTPSSTYLGYYDSSVPCTPANSKTIASLADGYAITYISHTSAKTYCANIGAHLITNQEWMTIARNAEQVAGNWTNNSVGDGALFSGHNDSSPNYILEASTDDNAYYGTGNTSPSNQKRTFTLSNGSVIWDISGNIWEHVQKDSSDTLVRYTPSDGGALGWRWIEHTAITDYGDLSYNEIRPSNSGWNATQGMGRVYTYNGDYGAQDRVLLRGGRWNHGATSGAFAMYLSWYAGSTADYVGFRCAR